MTFRDAALEPTTDVERAAAAIAAGGLVAIPTETVYGLAADATDPDAVARIFEVKGRPSGHPLIVHLGEVTELDDWSDDPPAAARRLARSRLAGPVDDHRPAVASGSRCGHRRT